MELSLVLWTSPNPFFFFPFFSSSTRFYYENLCIVEDAGLLFRCIFCSTLGEVDHDLFVICLFKFCVPFFLFSFSLLALSSSIMNFFFGPYHNDEISKQT